MFRGVKGVNSEWDLPAARIDDVLHNGPLAEGGITQTLLDKIPGNPTYQQLWDVYSKVYGDLGAQEWLDATWPYFEEAAKLQGQQIVR